MSQHHEKIQSGQKDWDDIYARLIESHDGLSEEESARLNSCLILQLVKHVPDAEQLQKYLHEARVFSQAPPEK